MSSPEKIIRMIYFWRRGLAMSKTNQDFFFFFLNKWSIFIWNSWRICDVYTNISTEVNMHLNYRGPLRAMSNNLFGNYSDPNYLISNIFSWKREGYRSSYLLLDYFDMPGVVQDLLRHSVLINHNVWTGLVGNRYNTTTCHKETFKCKTRWKFSNTSPIPAGNPHSTKLCTIIFTELQSESIKTQHFSMVHCFKIRG